MDKYTIFGNPINHSLSPKIHKYFAKQTGRLISYEKVLAPRDDFEGYVRRFVTSGGKGFNVTVPFKVEAYDLSDDLTAHARIAGAVNTVKVEDGQLFGHNTDGIGLVSDLCKNLGQTIKDKDILVLGAGGATKGILLPLLEQKPARILLANRTKSKALDLANNFSNFGKVCGFGLEQIKDKPVDIIINATSASLDGVMLDISSGVASGAFCYDLMYGNKTPFMSWALNNGAIRVVDGLGMLVEQAASSFEFWRGEKPETTDLLTSLKEITD